MTTMFFELISTVAMGTDGRATEDDVFDLYDLLQNGGAEFDVDINAYGTLHTDGVIEIHVTFGVDAADFVEARLRSAAVLSKVMGEIGHPMTTETALLAQDSDPVSSVRAAHSTTSADAAASKPVRLGALVAA